MKVNTFSLFAGDPLLSKHRSIRDGVPSEPACYAVIFKPSTF